MTRKCSIALCAVLLGLAALPSTGVAADALNLNAVLPKDFAILLRVDATGLMEADAFSSIENSIFKRIGAYEEFMNLLESLELNPARPKEGGTAGNETEGRVSEVVLLKRNLDTSTDDTSALVIGDVGLDYTCRKLRAKVGADKVKEIEYEGSKIYQFAGLFNKDETVYLVQIKGAIAFTLSENEAKEYLDRNADPATGLGEESEIGKKVKAMREGIQDTIWGLAFVSEARRKQFAESQDPEEMMLQFLKSAALKMELGKGTSPMTPGGAEITVACDCADDKTAELMEAALKTLREKLVTAFQNNEAKDALQKATIRRGVTDVTITISLDNESCTSVLESLGWMIFGSREEKKPETTPGETAPGETVPGETTPGETTPGGDEKPASEGTPSAPENSGDADNGD